mgnify:CR=1 FL=1
MKLPVVVHALVRQATEGDVASAQAVAGGCINQAARVMTRRGPLFVKWQQGAPSGFFESEVDGLERLAATQTVRVPRVYGVLRAQRCAAIAMEWIEPGQGDSQWMEDAGRRLAQLHSQRGLMPGLAVDNVIGALPQANSSETGESWGAFFRRQRLEALAPGLSARVRQKLERFDSEAFTPEPDGGCALLHGDLWSGNVVSGAGGEGWCVDPAVYAGHPEVDLAMTRLFGGFPNRFYRSYEEVAGPLGREWTDRAEVLNLYPLLVHVRLFGGGYERQVEAVLDRFAGSTR